MPTPNSNSSKTKGTTTAEAPNASAPETSAATEGTTAVATQTPPKPLTLATTAYDADDLGAGFEDISQEELAVPFVAILQKGSPQCEEGNPRAIPGAKPGMLINTVSNRVYDGKTGIRFVPVHRHRNFVEWIPRDDGGGFVGTFEPEAPEVKAALKAAGRKFGKLKIGDNNDLVETMNLFGLLLAEDGSFERVLIAFASTQIGAYKKLVTTAQSIQTQQDGRMVIPPLFAHVYRLRTEFTQKNNYTWFKFIASLDGPDAAACRLDRNDPLYENAKQFRAMLQSGAATAAYETAVQEETAGADNAGFEM